MTTQDDLLPVGLEDALPERARTMTTSMRAVLDAMDAHGYDRVRPRSSSSSIRWPGGWTASPRGG